MSRDDTSIGGSQSAFPDTAGTPADPRGPFLAPYWRPVYRFVRVASRASVEDAKDLTQDFFGYILENDLLSRFDPARGKFRHYLKGILRNFLSQARRDARAQKRGGGKTELSLDVAALEASGALAGDERLGPEAAFDRQWAAEILAESLGEARRELEAVGKAAWWSAWEAYDLSCGGAAGPTYASVGRETGLTADQVKAALAHVRGRLPELVRTRLARSAASPAEIGEDFAEIFAEPS